MGKLFSTALLLTLLSPLSGAWAGESAARSYEEGYRLQLGGQLEEAVELYSGAIELDTSFIMAYQMRGAAYQRMKKYRKALQDYTMVIELGEPNFRAAGYFNRGVVRNITGDYAGADQDFTQAIKLDRKMAPAFFHRAVSRSRTGDSAGRFEDFRSAARLGDHHAEEWLNRNHPGWREMPVAGGPT